nr:MAG: RNA dependent RNA polymerase [Picornaviridae sp.]
MLPNMKLQLNKQTTAELYCENKESDYKQKKSIDSQEIVRRNRYKKYVRDLKKIQDIQRDLSRYRKQVNNFYIEPGAMPQMNINLDFYDLPKELLYYRYSQLLDRLFFACRGEVSSKFDAKCAIDLWDLLREYESECEERGYPSREKADYYDERNDNCVGVYFTVKNEINIYLSKIYDKYGYVDKEIYNDDNSLDPNYCPTRMPLSEDDICSLEILHPKMMFIYNVTDLSDDFILKYTRNLIDSAWNIIDKLGGVKIYLYWVKPKLRHLDININHYKQRINSVIDKIREMDRCVDYELAREELEQPVAQMGLFYDDTLKSDVQDLKNILHSMAKSASNLSKDDAFGKIGDKLSDLIDTLNGKGLQNNVDKANEIFSIFSDNFKLKLKSNPKFMASIIVSAVGIYHYLTGTKESQIFMVSVIVGVLIMVPEVRKIENILIYVSMYALIPVKVTHIAYAQGLDTETLDQLSSALSTIFSLGVGVTCGKNIGLDIVKGLGDFGRIKKSISDIMSLVINTVEKVFNTLRNKETTPSYRFIDSNKSVINDFLDKMQILFDDHSRGVFNHSNENFRKLEDYCCEARIILEECSKDRSEVNILRILSRDYDKLRKIRDSFLAANFDLCGVRQESLGVCIAGGPGTLKSQVTSGIAEDVIAWYIKERCGDDEEKYNKQITEFLANRGNFIYSRNPENEYWDGSRNSHLVTIFDDFGQSKSKGIGEIEYFEWIRAVNPFEWKLHKAVLEEKGNTTFNSVISIMNTNRKDWYNLPLEDPAALIRRLNVCVIATYKEEYCINPRADIWNRKLDLTKTPLCNEFGDLNVRRLNFDLLEFHVVDFSPVDCEASREKSDKDKLAMRSSGVVLSFHELLTEVKRGVKTRSAWHKLFEQQMQEIRSKYTFEDLIMEPVAQMTYDGCTYELTDEVNFENLTITQALSTSRVECTFSKNKHHAESVCQQYFTKYCDELVDMPYFFRTIDQICCKLMPDINIPYVVKLALVLRLPNSPILSLDDTPYFLNIYLNALYDKICEEEIFYDLDEMDYCYNDKVEYKLENYKTFFMDFDRVASQPRMLNIVSVLCWIQENKTTCYMVGVALSMFMGVGIGNLLFSSREPYPESGVVTGRVHNKSVSRQSPAQKLNAKLEALAQMGPPGDPNCGDIIEKVLIWNSYEVTIDGSSTLGSILFLYGRTFVMNKHYLEFFFELVRKQLATSDSIITFRRCSSSFTVPLGDLMKSIEDIGVTYNDMVIRTLPQDICIMHKDITRHFVNESDLLLLPQHIPIVLSRNRGITRCSYTSEAIALNNIMIKAKKNMGGDYPLERSLRYGLGTDFGDCGSVCSLVNSKLGSRRLIGIHTAGSGQFGYSTILSREMIEEYRVLYVIEPSLPDDPNLVPDTNYPFNKDEPMPQMCVVGKLPDTAKRNTTNKMVKSPMYGVLLSDYTIPTRLNPINIDGILVDPLVKSLRKYCGNKTFVVRDLVDRSMKQYFDDISYLSYQHSRKILSVREAIEGIFLEPDSIGVNFDASSGYPMNTKDHSDLKKAYHEARKLGKEQEVIDHISLEIEPIIEKLKKGERSIWYYQDNNKPERRKIKKVLSYDLRLFSGSPFLFLVLIKMYFGSFVISYQKNRIVNGSTIGVNVYSPEWDMIVKELRIKNSDLNRIFAGDFSHYDGDLIRQILFAICKFINMWYRDINDVVRYTLFEDIMHSFHIVDGFIFEWLGGMPSGNPLTAIINTIYNNILIRMTWDLSGFELDIFKHLVAFFANGDDNNGSVDPIVGDKFSPKVISQCMKLLGMTYTNDNKIGEVDHFRTISDISYLKRKFVYSSNCSRWMAPLDINVVLDMINWTSKGKEYHTTVSNNMYTTVRELSLHPKEVFDKHVPTLITKYRELCTLPINSKCHWSYYDVQSEVLTSGEHYC